MLRYQGTDSSSLTAPWIQEPHKTKQGRTSLQDVRKNNEEVIFIISLDKVAILLLEILLLPCFFYNKTGQMTCYMAT